AADRRGAEICNQPLWLASALGKIARSAQTLHNPDAERNPATAHLFIINPLSGERMDNLFSTHPNTQNRIAALEAMAHEFGGGGGGGSAQRDSDTQTPDTQAPDAEASGPWGDRGGGRRPEAPARPNTNPWGRNPTGPRSGRR